MKSYIVSRATNEEYQHMIKIFEWCEKTFGKMSYDETGWHVGWVDSTDDLVKYTFYNDEYALLFRLRWL